MPVAARLALFAVLVAAAFGGAALLGGAVDPSGADEESGAHVEQANEGKTSEDHGGGADEGHAEKASASDEPETLPGLASAQGDLRLELQDSRRRSADRTAELRFRIVDADGRAVKDFEVEHEKRMHLIVVRRDLRGFQHLHPEMADDGTWSITADLSRPGVHRVYADFTIDGEQRTLGTDVHVPGDYDPAAVPESSTVSNDGDLEVTLRRSGQRFEFDVRRDGELVNDELQPYLGAKGHLVTLRADDLAYLHTHPDGDELAFDTELPSAGTYRLWVQFQLDGQIHTAAFTQEVER